MNGTIEAGQTIKARSLCDYETTFTAQVIERKGAFVTVKAQGNISRMRVRIDNNGEYVYALGRSSMAPKFRAAK